MEVRVTKRAQAQIDRAGLWWDENRPLAPAAFDEELAEAFSLLSAEPGIGAPAKLPHAHALEAPCFEQPSQPRAGGLGRWA
jgi:plasmid stabilization system protein ParE